MAEKIEILRKTDARKITGLGKSQFDEKQNPKSPYYDPTFPVGLALGGRAVGYYRHEIEAWIESRPRLTPEERLKRASATPKARRASPEAVAA